MTAIVTYRTKAALKIAAQKGENIYIEDPSPWGSRKFTAENIPVGETIIVTNHPKRSYFAEIEKTSIGLVVR